MSRCASCGGENAERDRYCGRCGAALDLRCPECGEPATPDRRFCGQCGTALHPPETPGADARDRGEDVDVPVAERRFCSVLFADLVGFTSLSSSRDAEDVRELLSRYFETSRRLIDRYGGTVEKFIGDAVMAVWGTPVATEEDAERAVRAALDLVSAVGVLGDELASSGLAARAAVVTGEVAVNLGARGEGMVAGDVVNTASRVQSLAQPGTVLVDTTTNRLVETAIALEDAGVHELRGRPSPEPLFRAVRVLSGVGGKQRVDGLEGPLIGREPELRTVKDLFHTAVDRRTARLAVVSGPAGVGKSRLGWEFEKYTDGLADAVLWHRGRCLSYGEGVAFWALAEVVRQRFGIAEEDRPEVGAAKLAEGVVRCIDAESEREYVGVRLARLLGISYDSDSRVVLSRDELFAGWRLFFERLAAVAPVVMLIEDVQHADEGLLEFFSHLVEWTRGVPIFVLLFARPGVPAIDAGYGVGRNRSTVSLDPLDDASMEALVGSLAPGIPEAERHAIAARAQGIPLFAIETVRSLIDQGVVAADADGVFRVTGEVAPTTVPHSLHGLLAARLDALPRRARALVGAASVIGTTFHTEWLTAAAPDIAGDVESELAELVRRGVLEITADPLSPERGAYRFSQELLRQVAYETLSKRDRKAKHLAVAAHLRAVFPNDGETIADVIARHYLDAVASDTSGADTAELRATALDFLVRAAEHARYSGAPVRASQTFEEAAAIAPSDAAAPLAERAARIARDAGEYARAIDLAERVQTMYAEAGDLRGAARAQAFKGATMQVSGRTASGRKELLAALAVLRTDPDDDTVDALRRLAHVEVFAGNLAEGERFADEALRLAQQVGCDTGAIARIFDAKGIAAVMSNRLREAAIYMQIAADIAERTGDFGLLTIAQHNLADVLARTDPARAAETARSAAAHARRAGNRPDIGLAVANLSIALLELGEWDEAERALRAALEVDGVEDEDVRRLAGWLAGLRGDAGDVAAALERLPSSRSSEELQARASVSFLEALAAESAGTLARALACARETLGHRDAVGIGHESQRWAWPLATRAARTLGDAGAMEELVAMLAGYPAGHLPPVLRAERALVDALLLADSGEPDGADAVAAAVDTLRAAGNPYHLAQGLIDWAGVLRREGRGREADVATEEAASIATRLRSVSLQARARAWVAEEIHREHAAT